MNLVEYPTDEILQVRYQEIEIAAIEALKVGRLVGNSTLKRFYRGDQWSISTQGFIYGSHAGSFLEDAISRIKVADSSINLAAPEFLHISFTEVAYNNKAQDFNSVYGGPPRVLFVAVGRFKDSPIPDQLLPILDQLNSEIQPSHQTDIRDIKIISTGQVDYKDPRGHIEIWPPLALNGLDQIQSDVRFLRPTQRSWYHRLQRRLMEEPDV